MSFSLPFSSSLLKASDTPGDFIRRSPRSAKIARCVRCRDCDFADRRDRRQVIADIWHVRYRRLNSPAFVKCALPHDFLRSLLQIVSKANPSGWAILSHDFSKLPQRRDWRKQIAKCVRFNRWRKSLTIFAGDQIRPNRQVCRWLKLPTRLEKRRSAQAVNR